jgi:hypothetical protein
MFTCMIHSLHKIPTGVLNSDTSFLMHLFQTEKQFTITLDFQATYLILNS